VHAIRNAVDHGIEDHAQRLANAKAETGTIRLLAEDRKGDLVIRIEDDGGGIDWARLEESAARNGVTATTPVDLLFADGVSSKTNVTALSGRGVGMSALRAATTTLGGNIDVRSELGRGTSLEFRFPNGVTRGATPRPSCAPPSIARA